MSIPYDKTRKDKKEEMDDIPVSVERIEVMVYPNQVEDIEKVIKEFQVPYVRTRAESYGFECYYYIITIPSELTDIILDKFVNIIKDKQKLNIITHYRAESSISRYLKMLVNDFIKQGLYKPKPTTIESLVTKTDAFLKRKIDLYFMTLIATIIALVGLVTDNVAVIIGAMLISPLLSPITSLALNSILGRQKQINQSLLYITYLLTSSILLAMAVTSVLSYFIDIEITKEIMLRTNPQPTDILIAVILGIAGGIALLSALPEIIVGVAIAVALIPPATVSGLGLGLNDVTIAFGALIILFENVVGMIMGMVLIFVIKGVSPRRYYEKQKAKKVAIKAALSLLSLIIAIILLELYLNKIIFV
ncbi:MAG: hypothetical protein KatS3mg003_0622 [Candidatus Nitrosocaldaceae archaeon]|nr:MAG: hypothetical protein KatS3mg003_0622 [Candidatus Nitrosocaldaceae archaeon]